LVSLILFVTPLTNFFEFEKLNLFQLMIAFGTGFVSVIWFEIVKIFYRKRGNRDAKDVLKV
jgi:Ca2+-transporting ATPase